MRRLLRAIVPPPILAAWRTVKPHLIDVDAIPSYSQEGEDMILRQLFSGRSRGFFVDVGAHHPRRFSNTYYFYKRGWSGINLDATPGSMALFRRWRPRDINLELAVGPTNTQAVFHLFNEPALNTFDVGLARERERPPYHLVERRSIPVQPLADILTRYLPAGQSIDFLTVDVEGRDLAVLQSNDWQRFQPECVMVECLDEGSEALPNNPAFHYMLQLGYEFFAKTVHTLAFRRASDA